MLSGTGDIETILLVARAVFAAVRTLCPVFLIAFVPAPGLLAAGRRFAAGGTRRRTRHRLGHLLTGQGHTFRPCSGTTVLLSHFLLLCPQLLSQFGHLHHCLLLIQVTLRQTLPQTLHICGGPLCPLQVLQVGLFRNQPGCLLQLFASLSNDFTLDLNAGRNEHRKIRQNQGKQKQHQAAEHSF